MVGIHALFGVSRDKKTRVEKLSQYFTDTPNGHLSSQPPKPSTEQKFFKTSLTTRLSNTLKDVYKLIANQLLRCKGTN